MNYLFIFITDYIEFSRRKTFEKLWRRWGRDFYRTCLWKCASFSLKPAKRAHRNVWTTSVERDLMWEKIFHRVPSCALMEIPPTFTHLILGSCVAWEMLAFEAWKTKNCLTKYQIISLDPENQLEGSERSIDNQKQFQMKTRSQGGFPRLN